MNDFESGRISAYFSHLTSQLGNRADLHAICVAHMVPNAVHFIQAVSKIATVSVVLAKPKSYDRPETEVLREMKFRVDRLDRGLASSPSRMLNLMEELALTGKTVVILDIGAYFAKSIDDIADAFDGTILGVMEGTENGAQEYEKCMPRKIPVVTVARSPLKLPEDYLVGSSIVFSVEAVLRDHAQILQTRSACVIGYGRVGSGVADVLRGRGISTVVHDKDPIKMAEASARGFQAFRRLDAALSNANLIVCATGNKALDKHGFMNLKSGAVVATVTSADSELEEDDLVGYNPTDLPPFVTRYDEIGSSSRYFWLINNGNAANFIHGAIIGPAIQLIEGEKLAAIDWLSSDTPRSVGTSLNEVDEKRRLVVANVWNEHFLND